MILGNRGEARTSANDPQIDELCICVVAGRQGDLRALGRLYEISSSKIYRFCFFLTGSTESAQDLCQETFIKAYGSLESLKDPEHFVRWAQTIARNRFLDQKRVKALQAEDLKGHDELESDLSILLGSENLEGALEVRDVLIRMDEEDRSLLVLAYVDGYSLAEIGGILKISDKAVKSRSFRARQKFFQLLSENGETIGADPSSQHLRRNVQRKKGF